MNNFIIYPSRDTETGIDFLSITIQGFYHTDFGGSDFPNNPNYLYKFKFDPHHKWSDYRLKEAQQELTKVLIADLPQIYTSISKSPLTICVVPRSKANTYYRSNQLLFKDTIKNTVNKLGKNYVDGTDYIIRYKNTKTTHLRTPIDGFNNDGAKPYPGISKDSCIFEKNIMNKNILLIDDIYTKTVNIDEDMIQALIDNGASSVAFYAIGKTI